MLSHGERRRRRVYGLVFGLAVVVAAAAVAAVLASTTGNSSNTTAAATSPSACNVTSVAQRELPSVVTIMAGGAGGAGGVGSGEVIRSDGYILTNNHVIVPAVGGGTLHVAFEDGKSANATIVGRDVLTDVAVIRVSGQSGLRTISIGDSAKLQIGEPVVALGAPLGLSNTVTSGIVSALGRTVHVPAEGSQTGLLIDAVQTDAAINPGNSGGALVDCSGALVGVPTAGATVPSPLGESSGGSIGLGFAIPSNFAKKIADEIIDTGRVTHAFLGLQAQSVSANTGHAGAADGLFVSSVTPGGPAASAGLQTGDIIRTIAGSPAVSSDQLMAITLTKRAGDRVEIGYERNGSRATANITLAAQST
jgi:putative serine protease PepD